MPSDDAGALGPRSPRFTPRTPSPRRWPLVVVALVVIALAGLVVSSLLGMRFSFLYGASPTVTATTSPTVTPEPTVFSIPLGTVQPAANLPASARLGGTMDGFTKAFGPQFDPANFPSQWQWHIGGQPAWIRVGQAMPADAADGHAHVAGFYITASQYPPITGGWDPTSAEAFVLALLPPDATYAGDAVGDRGVKVHVYHSAALATLFAPHASKIFANSATGQPIAPGTVAWYCLGSMTEQADVCIVGTFAPS
ncbi:MAG TPA: hypothetical protein VF807_15195 [Ktedonobacterales bacterium]